MFLQIIKEFYLHLTSIGLDSQFITAKLVDEKEFQVASDVHMAILLLPEEASDSQQSK